MQKIEQFNQSALNRLNSNYQLADNSFKEIQVHQRPILKNLSSKRIIYSLHGFLGTPFEMSYLDDEITKNNFAVYHDVIPGFSGTARIANSYQWSQWTADLEAKMEMLFECYEEIYLMGFSTGALLLHHYLITNSENEKLKKKVKGAILYSPFYTPFFRFGPVLNKVVSKFVQEIPLEVLYAASKVPDMKIMIKQPQNYLMKVPLKTATQIENLGAVVQKIQGHGQVNIPVLGFLSRADRIANTQISEAVLRRDFGNIEIKIFTNSAVPHHLMVPEVNDLFSEVKNEVFKYLGIHG